MKKEIAFLGDSMIKRGNWSALFPNHKIKNLGVSGDKTYDVLKNIEKIDSEKTSKAFLMAGINDLGDGRAIIDIRNDYSLLISNLLNKLSASNTVTLSVLPVNNRFWSNVNITTEKIIRLNHELMKVAMDKKVLFLNIHDDFTDEGRQLKTIYTTDGLHLNTEGYIHFKKLIYNYI